MKLAPSVAWLSLAATAAPRAADAFVDDDDASARRPPRRAPRERGARPARRESERGRRVAPVERVAGRLPALPRMTLLPGADPPVQQTEAGAPGGGRGIGHRVPRETRDRRPADATFGCRRRRRVCLRRSRQ